MKNDRLLKVLNREPVDRTPLWIMRQAGRYLPEYRQLRSECPDFMRFCKTPALATEATLQPLRRFKLDAAIIFSDILTLIDALGFKLEYLEKTGPVVHDPVTKFSDLQGKSVRKATEKLQYVYEAIALTKKKLAQEVPLIGFAGSPWTVACYLLSGRNVKQFEAARRLVYQHSALLQACLTLLTDLTVSYLNNQIEAGAQVIMLFDSWGGLLSSLTYREFSLNFMQQIGQRIHREYNGVKIPLIFFAKNAGPWLEWLAASNCDAIGLDWTVDLATARLRTGDKKILQGNLDPLTLYGTPASVRAAVKAVFAQYGQGNGLVFNLGHGIDKDTPLENVEALVEAVHEFGTFPRPCSDI